MTARPAAEALAAHEEKRKGEVDRAQKEQVQPFYQASGCDSPPQWANSGGCPPGATRVLRDDRERAEVQPGPGSSRAPPARLGAQVLTRRVARPTPSWRPRRRWLTRFSQNAHTHALNTHTPVTPSETPLPAYSTTFIDPAPPEPVGAAS